MINFFRKIRKQLADDNKPLKYARYAFGEIVLVVIGILIALSINNWNEEKKERVQEQKYLIEIKKNLEADIVQIENIGNEYQHISSKIDTLLIFIKDANPKTTNYNKLWKYILDISYVPSFKTQKNGYNNLISVGNINQIKNQELMKKISSHYSSVDYSNELMRQTIYESSQFDIHPPIKNLVGKKEFLADLGYEFQTTSISENDLSNNENLISGLLYKKMWVGVGLVNIKEWTDKTFELIENITSENEKKK
jgi:hypothetical protein